MSISAWKKASQHLHWTSYEQQLVLYYVKAQIETLLQQLACID